MLSNVRGKQSTRREMSASKLPPSPAEPPVAMPFRFKSVRSPKTYANDSGGYECEFVVPPPDVLPTECAICLHVLREPHLISCCGHNYCRSCISPVAKGQRPCPLCSEPTFTVLHNKGLERSLNEQLVRCPRSAIGCGWTGALGKLLRHLNEEPEPGEQLSGCDYIRIECAHGCGAKLLRHVMGDHQANQCPQRPYSCIHCNEYESIHADVVYRHWPVCKSFPIPCPNNCSDYHFERRCLDSHLEEECPLRVVECDFHYAGCDEKRPRREMEAHLKESHMLHLSLLATINQKLCEEVLEKDEQISKLSQEVDARVSEVRAELKDEIASLRTQNSCLQEEVASLRSQASGLRESLAEEGRQRAEMERKMERSTQAGRESFQEEIDKLYKQLEGFKAALMRQCYSVQAYVGLFPTEFTLPNFEQLLQTGRDWYSPPVYSHLEGYRFCLCVNISGHNSQKGTHISVYICLMRGEFDHQLSWPFRGEVTIQLLNRLADRNHATGVIHFTDHTPSVYSQQVVEGERAGRGWGQQKFISHSDLSYNAVINRQYLLDDSLQFRIVRVKCS